MARRGFGEDSIYFGHSGDCRDVRHHKVCPGQWRGAVSPGYQPGGKRMRRKVSGRTKQQVKNRLAALHGDLYTGIRRPDARSTVARAVADWLAEGFVGRSQKTVALNRHVLQPVGDSIGRVPLRDLTTRDVRRVLTELAAGPVTDRCHSVIYRRSSLPGRRMALKLVLWRHARWWYQERCARPVAYTRGAG